MNLHSLRDRSHFSTENVGLRNSLPIEGGFKLLVILALVFMVAAVTIVMLYVQPSSRSYILPTQVGLLLIGVSVIFVLLLRVYREVIKPIGSVRRWAARMREGDYTAELAEPIRGEFARLLHDLSEMGRWYKELAIEGDDRFSEQVRQMARKTRLLEILYDIAATINVSRDLKEMLLRFLELSADITHARAALVRLTNEDGDMSLVGAIGAQQQQFREQIPMLEAIPGSHSPVKSVYVTSLESSTDFARFDNSGDPDDALECIIIPLLHQGNVMGSYHLLVDRSMASMSYDLHELFTSIGYHLGMAAHKSHLDDEAKKRTIVQERLTLAHELHDSLAQSLVSLRFQCKALDDSLSQADLQTAGKDVQKLRIGVDKANAELRNLLVHFRAPIDERGLAPALADMAKNFREETRMLVFSQFDCEDVHPPMHIQRQVIRIAQEALANIKKHADARTVRILLRVDDDGQCNLLIEDDGHGFAAAAMNGASEHVGLSVMRERAARINAMLHVESEPSEGTRVELTFALED